MKDFREAAERDRYRERKCVMFPSYAMPKRAESGGLRKSAKSNRKMVETRLINILRVD